GASAHGAQWRHGSVRGDHRALLEPLGVVAPEVVLSPLAMRYKATHSTRYRYDAAVSQCQSEVRLTPRALPWQSLIESRIEVTPDAASIEAHKDYFGNDVTTFTILESHDRFVIVSTSVVDVQPRPA